MDRIAVNRKTALKMFWDAGFDTESALVRANDILNAMPQPTKGFWHADTVSMVISMTISRQSQPNHI